MTEERTLECFYTPADFFEEPIGFAGTNYLVEIANGRAVATFLGELVGDCEVVYRDVYARINAFFLGAQLSRNKPYQLSAYTTTRRHGGNVEVGLSVGATLRMTTGAPNVVLRDAAGNVISDTRRERIVTQTKAAGQALKHQNHPIVVALLKSYHSAIADPQNEFTHLYEIRDTMKEEFGGEDIACGALHISKNRWKQLRILANVEPLEQGRHRGQNAGRLRDATTAELEEGRVIARQIIQAYLDYLDRKPQREPNRPA